MPQQVSQAQAMPKQPGTKIEGGMIGRIVIEGIRPSTPTGRYPAKGVAGKPVRVSADVFRDGKDLLTVRARWRKTGRKQWEQVAMQPMGNDRWAATFGPDDLGLHDFVIEAWTDLYGTWIKNTEIKLAAGQSVEVELEEGAALLEAALGAAEPGARKELARAAAATRDGAASAAERFEALRTGPVARLFQSAPPRPDLTCSDPLQIRVERPLAGMGAWYEMFPRSEGGFAGAAKRLEAVKKMGFDVVYLPPIHPIGVTHRKGKNNTLTAGPGDPGSPWAIGSAEGGHTAIHPDLGTFDDFAALLKRARELGMEVALDYALQCSPDHPWVKKHPEWFLHRPDGTIKFAENPPKKYQDIYPINFWPAEGRQELWQACKQILDFWIDKGVKIFRVDNPHTKPLALWEWMIPAIADEHPEVIFLAEAFTAPKMMSKLAEIGFSQSYTYFTWRTGRQEIIDYAVELALSPKADYMRPNLWPNTPDILSGPLRRGRPAAFKQRLVLAATLSPSYGIYSGYELSENSPASDTDEEYLNSEKYEIKKRDWDSPMSLAPYVRRVNEIRRRHAVFEDISNIAFHNAHDPAVLAYSKTNRDLTDVMLIVVSLDPNGFHESTLWLDLQALGLSHDRQYHVVDELNDQEWMWYGSTPQIHMDPGTSPARILRLEPRFD